MPRLPVQEAMVRAVAPSTVLPLPTSILGCAKSSRTMSACSCVNEKKGSAHASELLVSIASTTGCRQAENTFGKTANAVSRRQENVTRIQTTCELFFPVDMDTR